MPDLQLDPVGVERLGRALNQGVTGSDLFVFNRMALAAVLGKVSKRACAEAERLVRRPFAGIRVQVNGVLD